MKKTVAFYTLGCKVNQYETNAMEQQFIKKGYEVVDNTETTTETTENTPVDVVLDENSAPHREEVEIPASEEVVENTETTEEPVVESDDDAVVETAEENVTSEEETTI